MRSSLFRKKFTVIELREDYPDLPKGLLEEVVMAYTENLYLPHIGLLAIIDTINRGLQEDWSNDLYPAARLPFCIMSTAQKIRWKTPFLRELHDVMTGFILAERNMYMIRCSCIKHGIVLTSFCSCGIMAFKTSKTEEVGIYLGNLNSRNSKADSFGYPVVDIESLNQVIDLPGIDLFTAEILAYQRMELFLRSEAYFVG